MKNHEIGVTAKGRVRNSKGVFQNDPAREEAKANGQKRYLGPDCPQKHGGLRFVSNYGCCECLKIQCREYHSRNKKEMNKRSRDYAKADPIANSIRTQRWNKKNPHYMKMVKNTRRQLIKISEDKTLTSKEWEEIKTKFHNTCLCCGRKEPEIKLEIDHIISIKNGGYHTYDNIQPLCRRCNAVKNSQNIDYRGFYEDMGGFWNINFCNEPGAGNSNNLP